MTSSLNGIGANAMLNLTGHYWYFLCAASYSDRAHYGLLGILLEAATLGGARPKA